MPFPDVTTLYILPTSHLVAVLVVRASVGCHGACIKRFRTILGFRFRLGKRDYYWMFVNGSHVAGPAVGCYRSQHGLPNYLPSVGQSSHSSRWRLHGPCLLCPRRTVLVPPRSLWSVHGVFVVVLFIALLFFRHRM